MTSDRRHHDLASLTNLYGNRCSAQGCGYWQLLGWKGPVTISSGKLSSSDLYTFPFCFAFPRGMVSPCFHLRCMCADVTGWILGGLVRVRQSIHQSNRIKQRNYQLLALLQLVRLYRKRKQWQKVKSHHRDIPYGTGM